MDLAAYRTEAEAFSADLTRAHYRHYAGLDPELAIEPVYAAHAGLFDRPAVEALREVLRTSSPAREHQRRLQVLFAFAVEGHLSAATREQEASLARTEAALRIEVDGAVTGFRTAAIRQANDPDPDRRERIEAARLDASRESLEPLAGAIFERTHAVASELGWPSYRAMWEELHGIDLGALERQVGPFTTVTNRIYADVVEGPLRTTTGRGLATARRSDLPRFFRCAELDAAFPPGRLVEAFEATLRGLGIDPAAQQNVILDVESRRLKSPRAFCAPVRVPGEIYLVVPPVGGRDDYLALLHEGGHAQHYAAVDPGISFEFRVLGDNSVTEAFAFLFEHLVDDPEWLRLRLGIEDTGELGGHVRAQRLVMTRRHAAKLLYELELHGGGDATPDALAGTYAARMTEAVGVPWPRETFLTDVDPGFYCVRYLRAWTLETHLRSALREQYGLDWFDQPAAGSWLRALMAQGQRLDAEELLAELTHAKLDLGALLPDVAPPNRPPRRSAA
jgi:hypothetical protein